MATERRPEPDLPAGERSDPASATVTARGVAARVWLTAQLSREDGAGPPLSTRVTHIAAETMWLLRLAREAEDEDLVGQAHRAALAIGAEALLAAQEVDPRLKHRRPNYLQQWMREKLKQADLSPPDAWEQLLDPAVEIVYLSSYVAHVSGVQREARTSARGSSKASKNELPAALRSLALKAATFAAKTWHEDLELEEGFEILETFIERESASSVDIADPWTELAGLQSRRDTLLRALTEAVQELKRSGAPLPGRLVDQVDTYERDIQRLAGTVEGPPELPDIKRRLADRDPRRKALRALADLSIDEGGQTAAVQDIRLRAASALKLLEQDTEAPDLEILLWLHDWIAAHLYGLERPDPDVVMAHLLKAGVPITLAISPEIDRLHLGLAHGAEPTRARGELDPPHSKPTAEARSANLTPAVVETPTAAAAPETLTTAEDAEVPAAAEAAEAAADTETPELPTTAEYAEIVEDAEDAAAVEEPVAAEEPVAVEEPAAAEEPAATPPPAGEAAAEAPLPPAADVAAREAPRAAPEPAPTPTSEAPAPTSETPTPTSEAPPADVEAPPADTGAPPADTGAPPADTGAPPADIEARPADVEARPADAEAPAAEAAREADSRLADAVARATAGVESRLDEELLKELVGGELAGVAACYLPREDRRRQALELLGLACAVRSSGGSCAQEIGRRASRLIGLLDTKELRAIGFAAGLRCAITGPTAAVDILEGLKETAADGPALGAIGDRVLLAAQQGFELARDVRGLDPSSIQERVDDLADEARRWLERPGMTSFQRASRLWRHWVDERQGRLGQLLVTVAGKDLTKLERLRGQVEDLRANLDRHLTDDDRALRGHGSQRLEGRARRELHRRAEGVIQIGVEALAAWEAFGKAERDARRASPKAASVMGELTAVLAQHLAEAQAEIAAAPELALGATALAGALVALDRGVSLREAAPSAPEPSPEEALRGALLATDIPLDEELEPEGWLTDEVGWALVGRAADLGRSFEARLRLGELHNARLILGRLVAEGGGERDALEAQLDQRTKQLTGELDEQVEQARSDIDRHWRLGHLSHETCTRLFQELEQVAQRSGDPDAGLYRQLTRLREQIADEARRQIPTRIASLRRRLAEVGTPKDDVRAAIEDFIAAEDLASAEDAIEALRRGDTAPVLAVRGQRLDDLRAFLRLIPQLADVELSVAAAREAVQGNEPLAGLDFAAVRATDSRDAVTRALERWFALVADGSLFLSERQQDLREHVLAVLLTAGFGVQDLSRKSPFRKASSNAGMVEFEMRMRPRWRGVVPQFGSDAQALRVTLFAGQAVASADELFQVARGSSESPCVALVPRVLSLAQRQRIAALHRKDQSGAPVLFIDTAAFLYICSRGAVQIEPTMRITLPFTTVNPYMPFRGRQVPDEMFFGREQEVNEIMSRDGYSFVYGGRRLGKSSLLEEVKRRANSADEQIRAVVVDLQDAGIGRGGPPSTLLALLANLLAEELDVEQPSKRAGDGDRLRQVVGAWLGQDQRRQLLVLLDETDEFLQADADTHFQTINELHDLQVTFKRRFKPVFAGLHQVKRFNDVPNQRLAHFGDKVAVGPLHTTEALELVEKPLGALGFRFAPASAAHRILTATRNQPSLIQLVCHHLLRHKLAEPLGEEELDLPLAITHEDVVNVLARPNVASEVRDRLELTINLDPRYRVILLVVAFGQLEREVERPLRAREIERECRDWWAAGFAGTADYEFDALLGEMCELGVLYHAEGAYRLQSPTIERLLGTPDSIMDELLGAAALRPPERFNASTHHEALKTASANEGGAPGRRGDQARERDPYRRNPLTIEQVQELCRRQNRLVVVLGTAATNLAGVSAALSLSGLEETAGEVRRTFTAIERRRSYEGTRDAFLSQLRRVGKRMHKIVLFDDSAGGAGTRALVEQSLKAIGAGGRRVDGTVCGLILVRARGTITSQLVEDDDYDYDHDYDGHGGDGEAERRLVLLPLRRWEARGLLAWSHDDVEPPLGVDRWREELLKVTGGWPLLVDRVMDASRGRGSDTFGKALADLQADLETPAGASELLAAVGLEDEASLECRAWKALVNYAEPISLTRTIAGDVGTLADIEDERGALVAYRTLRFMDALAIDERRHTVAAEPVLAAAWSRAHG